MKKYEKRIAEKRQRLENDLRELNREIGVAEAFIKAELPEPDFVCVHDVWSHVGYYRNDRMYEPWQAKDAVDVLEKLLPFVVRMEPARSSSSLSIYPPAARKNPDQYNSEGWSAEVDLYQSAFGEEAGSPYPSNYQRELRMWVQIGGYLAQVCLRVDIPPKLWSQVRWNGRSNFRDYPNIPGSKLVKYGSGSAVGLESHHLFDNFADLKSALEVS